LTRQRLRSQNCHRTTSILTKRSTNVDWSIAFVVACEIVNFPLTVATMTSQFAKNHFFCIVLSPSRLISKCCNFSIDWDRVNSFSALVSSYMNLKIDPRLFVACHMSKTFLAMRGGCRNLQTPKSEGGTSSFLQPLDVPFWLGLRQKKNWQFFNNIFQAKTDNTKNAWSLSRAFLHCLSPQKGVDGQKAVKTRLYKVYKKAMKTIGINASSFFRVNTCPNT
jgi:hypothetical protein